MTQKVLSYDLGGTKVAVGVVNSRGRVLEETRAPARISQGKNALIDQLAELGQLFLKKYREIDSVGMASAGPLDPATGVLLDPTNFSSSGKGWGKFPIAKLLTAKLKRRVTLENDAAAAALAEHWIGAARGYKNAMILTLGTGLGTGVICNGELLRSGRMLHPEAGHIIINSSDESAPCGCGNQGCAEAYLSGRSFERRIAKLWGKTEITSPVIANLARSGDARALKAFEDYAGAMAIAIHNYVVLYAPEIIVFTGGFAADADLFIKSTRVHLEKLLARRRVGIDLLPKLAVSTLHNQAGIIGGAKVAFKK